MKKFLTFLLALAMSATVIGGSLLSAGAAEPVPEATPTPTPIITVAPTDPGESDFSDTPTPKPDTL